MRDCSQSVGLSNRVVSAARVKIMPEVIAYLSECHAEILLKVGREMCLHLRRLGLSALLHVQSSLLFCKLLLFRN